MTPHEPLTEIATMRCFEAALVCAACIGTDDLAPSSDDDTVLFCGGCRDQRNAFALDDPFIDLGGCG